MKIINENVVRCVLKLKKKNLKTGIRERKRENGKK